MTSPFRVPLPVDPGGWGDPLRVQIKCMPTGIAFRYDADGKHYKEGAPENRHQGAQADLYDVRRGCLVLRVRPRGLRGPQEFWVYAVENSWRDDDGVSTRYVCTLLTMFSVPKTRKVEQ